MARTWWAENRDHRFGPASSRQGVIRMMLEFYKRAYGSSSHRCVPLRFFTGEGRSGPTINIQSSTVRRIMMGLDRDA